MKEEPRSTTIIIIIIIMTVAATQAAQAQATTTNNTTTTMTTTVFGLYEDATSEYFEQRGYRILEYSFEDNGTLVIIAVPT